VIGLGAAVFAVLVPRAVFAPILPLLLLVVVSSLTSAFKVHFPIASGSTMSVSYVVDIAALILRGPHATMIVGAASGWSQSTFRSPTPNPPYRTLFNMAILVLTVQTAGQVYQRLGGTTTMDPHAAVPIGAMAVTYFFLNTVPIAVAIALTTRQSAWRVWKTQFASSAPSYLLGAGAAVIAIAVTQSAGAWLTLLLAAGPLYLTYKVYRAGVETEARQGAILEAAHDAIITVDPSLNIREFNPAAEQMFGRARMDILGRSVDLLVPEGGRAAWTAALAEFRTTGGGPFAGQHIELTGLKADGTEFPAELSVARVGSENRQSVTAFVRDITERRTLEEQLRQSQKLEAIGRLASGVAHDFNNILMSIMGSAELLLVQLQPQDPAEGEAREITLSVQRGASLTRQLLAFSRRQATVPRLFEIGEVVAGMDTMLRRLSGPEIEFEVVQPRPVHVVADQAQIEQVVLNLVINARDAMPRGGRLTITMDEVELVGAPAIAATEGEEGHYARLVVADTGIGIDEQTRARLFEPFFTTKEQGKGTGLGLSIVYGIVKQSGGYITVTSEPGHGAAFAIFLPLASVPAPEPPVAA
jgi:PAS domain S-box-containing protein